MNKSDNIGLLNDLLNYSHDMVFIIRIDNGHIEHVNQTSLDNIGYTLKEMNDIGLDSFRRPIDKDEPFLQHLQDLKLKNSLTDYAYVIRKDGTEFPIEVNAKLIHRSGVDYNVAIVRDITERMEAEKKLQDLNKNLELLVIKKTSELQKNVAFLKSYKRAMDESNIVSKSDLNGMITYVNNKFCEVTGYTKEEVIGRPHSIVRHPDSDSKIFRELWNDLRTRQPWQGILKNKKKDGSHYWVDINILPIIDDKGEVLEYMAVRHEITELIDQRETLQKIATTDTLTNLGNRYKLINDIALLENPSIAILDIERFSEINDFYGDSFGDIVIKELGYTLLNLIKDRSTKQLYRLQNDVFAILNLSLNKDHFIANIEDIIEKIENITYKIDGKELMLNIRSSISFEKNNLFITADMAMKSAKKNRINMLVYDEGLNLDSVYENNIKYTNKLREAIESDNLVPYYQAIVNNKTGKWEKYESLVRMIDENKKIITPFFFLEIAKRTKHYETLTKTVIKKTFDTFNNTDIEFSINLTIKDIMNKNIQNYICDLLQTYNVNNQVVFEIVESEGIDNYDEVIAFINQVKKHACKIAIDDFGTGYSNFNYLLKLQADYIKIDGSLIKNIDTDMNARILVKTIVNFAKELNISTIAEYVENSTIYEIVKDLGIDYSQGYFFSAPLEFPDFTK
ncbi:MAG: EAL domain-containing protein [Sulfurimonas sp.]|nr:EAL domain-containing protein [Sulfurimonas sp.]MBU3939863.1 EAL domain-containing protein [bacterium]MBU4025808.1 EAL domain-containing protein [bacterium]MBU4058032.1 EAL domain-containing protein [bacterium]MBU4109933.1 EAL domain-containing protein [bacterium]